MLKLEEIVEFPEIASIKKQYGSSKDAMEDYMKDCKDKNGGFIDPWQFARPDRREAVYETMRKWRLSEMLGGGTGSDFMSYMIPTKVYQVLYDAFTQENILDNISAMVVRDFEGGSLNFVFGLRDKIKPRWGAGPGAAVIETEEVSRSVITPKTFSCDMAIAKDFYEDSAFDLIEHHIAAGGAAMANFAVARALEYMYANYDTVNNTEAGAADAVAVLDYQNVIGLIQTNSGMIADTAVITSRQRLNILADTVTFNFANIFKDSAVKGEILPKFLGLDWYCRPVDLTCSTTCQGDDGLWDMTNDDHYSLVFKKSRGLVTAWKRPITIENYTAPREGLVGAFASARIGYGMLDSGDAVGAILEA